MATEERTEQPTPRKRREAREKGQVANSVDLSRAVGLLALYLTWCVAGGYMGGRSLELVRSGLDARAAADLTPEQVIAGCGRLGALAACALAPVMIAAVAGAVLGTCTQTRLLLASQLLNPDLNRINPLSGFRRLVSWRGAVATLKGVIKVGLVLAVAAWVIRARTPQIVAIGVMELGQMNATMLAIAAEIVGKCAAMLLVLGAADYAYEWWEHERSLRMTRQEVRRHLREEEGDPHIRGRRRQLRRGMLEQGITREMPQASVVVTNPTQYAVALRYDAGEMDAPRVVAKGRRAIARRIVALARQWAIPVVEDPPVARGLFSMAALGERIPQALYQAVAEILAAVYHKRRERLERNRRGGGPR